MSQALRRNNTMKFYDIKTLNKHFYYELNIGYSQKEQSEYEKYISVKHEIEHKERTKVLNCLSKELACIFRNYDLHDVFIKNVNVRRYVLLKRLPEIRVTVKSEHCNGVLIYKGVSRFTYDDAFTEKGFFPECIVDELYFVDDGHISHNYYLHPYGEINIVSKYIEWKPFKHCINVR